MSDTAEKRVKLLRLMQVLREQYRSLDKYRCPDDDLAALDEIDNWVERQEWDCWRVLLTADEIMAQVIDTGREPLDDQRFKASMFEWQMDMVADMLEDMEIPRVPLDQEEVEA